MKKKNYGLLLSGFITMFLACQTTETSEVDAWSPDDPWEPSVGALTRSKPSLISRNEFFEATRGAFYSRAYIYLCSDSLGKVCFWDRFDKPTFNPEKIENGEPVFRSGGSYLYQFEDDGRGFCYFFRRPEDLSSTRKSYGITWCYDEEDGTFLMSDSFGMYEGSRIDIDKYRGFSSLMELTDKYMIVRYNSPWGISKHATYSLHVFMAVRDKDYAKELWYMDAVNDDNESPAIE